MIRSISEMRKNFPELFKDTGPCVVETFLRGVLEHEQQKLYEACVLPVDMVRPTDAGGAMPLHKYDASKVKVTLQDVDLTAATEWNRVAVEDINKLWDEWHGDWRTVEVTPSLGACDIDSFLQFEEDLPRGRAVKRFTWDGHEFYYQVDLFSVYPWESWDADDIAKYNEGLAQSPDLLFLYGGERYECVEIETGFDNTDDDTYFQWVEDLPFERGSCLPGFQKFEIVTHDEEATRRERHAKFWLQELPRVTGPIRRDPLTDVDLLRPGQ